MTQRRGNTTTKECKLHILNGFGLLGTLLCVN
jgi:hypothetical protein